MPSKKKKPVIRSRARASAPVNFDSAPGASQFQKVYASAPPALQSLLNTERLKAGSGGAEADNCALRMAGYAGWYEADNTWKQLTPDLRGKVSLHKLFKQPDGLFSVFDVPVFYANAVKMGGDGKPIKYEGHDVSAIVDNTNRSNQLPALTPYHVVPEQKLLGVRVPVLGKSHNFRAADESGWGKCDFRDLKPETIQMWKDRQISSFSPGIVEDAGGTNRRFGHIAMLGAEAPALSALPTTEIYSHESVCFAATDQVKFSSEDFAARVTGDENGYQMKLSANDTHAWAHKPGGAWPASSLAGKPVHVVVDSNGLVDHNLGEDADSHELESMVSDHLPEKFHHLWPKWAEKKKNFGAEGKPAPLSNSMAKKKFGKSSSDTSKDSSSTQFSCLQRRRDNIAKRAEFSSGGAMEGDQQFAGMSRQHFQKVADILKHHRSAGHIDEKAHAHMAHGFADFLSSENPRFDRGRFLKAAGASEERPAGAVGGYDAGAGHSTGPSASSFAAITPKRKGMRYRLRKTGAHQQRFDSETLSGDTTMEAQELEALKQDAEALNAAIAAAESGEEGADAKVEEALNALSGEGGGEPEGDPEPQGDPEPAVAGEDPDQQFAPSMDKFHGYDAATASQAFAANPQAAFASLVDLVGQIPAVVRAETGKLHQRLAIANRTIKLLQDRNTETDADQQFSAARSKFEEFLTSDAVKPRNFSAAEALATFDACGGDKATVEQLKKLIAASPMKATTPAGMGQVFDAQTASGDVLAYTRGSHSRPIRMSEILPGVADDEKMSNFAAKVADGYK